eukprot:snap_masked-scaffold_13-processed-gene-6.52-mRNA-1 protein AED:1.00 eAED:1.00 QI:0/-1/0/0/-1/1/1/0/381
MKKAITLSVLGFAAAYEPVDISFTELKKGGATVEQEILAGLTSEGLLSISNVPGFAELKKRALASASACALASKGMEDAFEFSFEDGTVRHTLASKTEGSEAQTVYGAEMTSPACVEFNNLEKEFRGVVDETVEAFLSQLDSAQGLTGGRSLLSAEDGSNPMKSFMDIKQKGVQLEHFHTYVKPDNEKLRGSTLDVHVDQGFMIALTPALMVDGGKVLDGQGHGFMVQLSSGEIVEPNLENTDLLFMVGQGVEQWVNEKLSKELRATPHSMTMPSGDGVRSWYGRMILPGKESYLERQGKTFGEMQRQAQSRNLSERQDMASSACSYGFELVQRNLQDCASGEILCWHQCMAADCDDAVCISGNTGSECSGHDSSCAPSCV